jgi:hypothetical protein
MQGDAIEQSRAATLAVVAALRSDDRVQVLRFGTETVAFFRRPLLATARVCQALCELVPTIDSNLGGTEMDTALERALRQLGPAEAGRARAIILVTDGAVQPHDVRNAQAAAIKAGVRFFVVAVGSSAATEVLGPLAQATGATLERAVPSEPIDAGVMRQFRRARQAGPVRLRVRWPQGGAVALPVGNVYAGDAVQLAAVLPSAVAGSVTVSAGEFLLALPFAEPEHQPAMRALCGMARYLAAARGARESLAMAYGLLTTETSAVLVKLRADGEVGDTLPAIVRVPQMVSKGTMTRARRVDESVCDELVCFETRFFAETEDQEVMFSLREATDADVSDMDVGKGQDVYKKDAPPPLDHDAMRRALSCLYRILQFRALDDYGNLTPLGKLVWDLPEDLRPLATAAIAAVYLSLDHPAHSLYLAVALNGVLALDELDDTLEFAISRLSIVEDIDDWVLQSTTTLHRLLGE